METEEFRDAYRKGMIDGEIKALTESVNKAHVRIDRNDSRITAIERVMYAGMGVIFLIELLPNIAKVAGTQ